MLQAEQLTIYERYFTKRIRTIIAVIHGMGVIGLTVLMALVRGGKIYFPQRYKVVLGQVNLKLN